MFLPLFVASHFDFLPLKKHCFSSPCRAEEEVFAQDYWYRQTVLGLLKAAIENAHSCVGKGKAGKAQHGVSRGQVKCLQPPQKLE